MDPWYDYLAFPIAPLILLVQLAGLAIPKRSLRRRLAVVLTFAILAMFAFVILIPLAPEEGANIGAGFMFFWLLGSLALLRAAL